MKSVIATSAALVSALLLSACASQPMSGQLQHQWALVSVDGVAVATNIKSELTIDDALKVSGRAGCNRFFGAASVTGDQLVADKLGVTMMACAPAVQKVEVAVLETLKKASFNVQGQTLELKGAKHTLVYQQAK